MGGDKARPPSSYTPTEVIAMAAAYITGWPHIPSCHCFLNTTSTWFSEVLGGLRLVSTLSPRLALKMDTTE